MNASALLLLASITPADTLVTLEPALEQAPTVTPAAVIVHHQPVIPIVAVRLSILADDPGGFAGAGHLMQHLHEPRLREQARRVGGRVQIQRNSDAIVYSVIGPAAELDYLAGILISALRTPSPTPGQMVGALRDLREERLAEWETAAAHVRASLRAQLFPEDLPAPGTASSSERLEIDRLPALWGEIYRPDRVSVVAVGDVRLEEVERVFSSLPERPAERLREQFRDTLAGSGLAPAEATRGWLGIGYPANELDAPAVTVTARLLGDVLRENLPGSEVAVEHWWTHHGQALVAVLAVPGSSLASARRDLGTALVSLQRGLSEADVRNAATSARREMLFHSRTPEQMAEAVGRFADRDGDPGSAQRFFHRLDTVGLEEVEEVVARLIRSTPARVDVPPQPLERR